MLTRRTLIFLRSILTFSLAIIFLGNWLFNSSILEGFIFPLLILVILMSFFEITGTSRIIGSVSFAVSVLLLLEAQAPLEIWQEGLKANLFLVVMFIMVPLLGIPIQRGGYTTALQGLFEKRVDTRKKYYLLVSLLTAFVGALVNLAVVPLVNQICRNSRFSANRELFSSAIVRGFSTCTTWAPTTASIGFILQITGSDWVRFFPIAIIFGSLMGLVGYIMTIYQEKDEEGMKSNPEVIYDSSSYSVAKVIELGAFALVLLGSIVFISWLLSTTPIVVVSLMALVYPLIWMTIIKKVPLFFQEFKGEYFHGKLPSVKNELILFLGAGFLATSINYSHFGDYVPLIFNFVVGDSAIFLTIFIFASILLLAGLGIHPIVTVTIIGGTVNLATFGLSDLYFALLLAISWSLGTSISPSSGTVIAVSGVIDESPLKVGIKWNGFYVILTSLVIVFFVTICRKIGLL